MTNYIEVAGLLSQLNASFRGVREPVDQVPYRELIAKRDYEGVLGKIADQLCIPSALQIGYVNSGGPEEASCWVYMPTVMPQFGSSTLRKSKFTVYVRKRFLAVAPPDTVVAAFAHEMSHIVLGVISHPLRHNEKAVDLTAMVLGYRHFFASSHLVSGYLSRDEYQYVLGLMSMK